MFLLKYGIKRISTKHWIELNYPIYLTGKQPIFIGSFHTNECRHFSWCNLHELSQLEWATVATISAPRCKNHRELQKLLILQFLWRRVSSPNVSHLAETLLKFFKPFTLTSHLEKAMSPSVVLDFKPDLSHSMEIRSALGAFTCWNCRLRAKRRSLEVKV